MINETPFYKFLQNGINAGGFTNDDVVAIMLPLLTEVLSFHDEGFVAPLQDIGSILITNEKLDINEAQKQNHKII
ncbi:MAG: hypothetical protein IPP29_21090 [Bacteroidetes bacterium]|nr:hypothetical protein [Bacteroidota bacterium]